MSFYRAFGRNRPIETINGYDGSVHRGPFQKYRGSLGCIPRDAITTVITSDFTARAFDLMGWSVSPSSRRASIVFNLI